MRRAVEAVLFVASEPLSIDRLTKIIGGTHVQIAEVLQRITEEYIDRGIVLREVAGGYRFAASPAARVAVEAYLKPPKTFLSMPAMETLAIIAYEQPVTKADIEAVRVPPSACKTSQSNVMVRSPKQDKSTIDRKHRPINRAISTDLPSLRARALSL